MSEEKSILTIHYFGLKARAHASVVANAYWGKEMKWEKYSFDDWKNDKNDIRSHCAFGQLPVLNDGDEWISQSNCILRYLGRKWGKAGSNNKNATLSDVLIEESSDIFDILVEVKYRGKNTLKAWDEAFKKLPKHWTNLEKLMNGEVFGDEILIGDMSLFAVINMIHDSDPHTLKNHVSLKKWYDAIANNDGVKALLANCGMNFKLPERPNFTGKYVCSSAEGFESHPKFNTHDNAKTTVEISQEGDDFKCTSTDFLNDYKPDILDTKIGTNFSKYEVTAKSVVEQSISWDGGNLVISTVDPNAPLSWQATMSLSDDRKTLSCDTQWSMKGVCKIIFKRQSSEKAGISGTWLGSSAEGMELAGDKFVITKEKMVVCQKDDDFKLTRWSSPNAYKEELMSFTLGTKFKFYNQESKINNNIMPSMEDGKLVLNCDDPGSKYTSTHEVSSDGSSLNVKVEYWVTGVNKLVYDRQ